MAHDQVRGLTIRERMGLSEVGAEEEYRYKSAQDGEPAFRIQQVRPLALSTALTVTLITYDFGKVCTRAPSTAPIIP